MLDKVAELNRVLAAMHAVGGTSATADRKAVVEACGRTVIEGRMPDHQATLEFAARLGMITLSETTCVLNPDGLDFFALNPQGSYDLTEEQKRVLIRTHYLGGAQRRACKRLFEAFAYSEALKTYRWSVSDGIPMAAEAWLLEHLCELGALDRAEGLFQVRSEYVKTIASFIEEPLGMTEERLQELLKENREVGELAEVTVMDYERARLRNAGYGIEAVCARRVAKVRENAGYDIESFDGASSDLVYDRMIEVKGARGADLKFFWSDNEMKVAARLGNRYWIYFQGGISLKTGQTRNKVLCFQDPHNSILTDATLTKTAQGLVVEGKLRGDRV